MRVIPTKEYTKFIYHCMLDEPNQYTAFIDKDSIWLRNKYSYELWKLEFKWERVNK